MSSKMISVTQKNMIIDEIATCIQKARATIYRENVCNPLDADNMVRLLCVVLFVEKANKRFSTLFDLSSFDWVDEFVQYYSLCDVNNIEDAWFEINKISAIELWEELLLYAFEAFEYEPDIFINSDIKRGIHIVPGKKKGGIFYTPSDVVQFMVSECVDGIGWENHTCLDCSCGSGAFLVEIVLRLIKDVKKETDVIESISHSVWGIDISYTAVLNCRFVIAMYCLKIIYTNRNEIRHLLELLDTNIVQGDALDLQSVIKTHGLPERYSCIIGNPPYISSKRFGNTFIPFVYNLMEFSEQDACGALVVPLSICNGKSKTYTLLRDRIYKDDAQWKIINFDRSPDSLFGDHVKTRNSILVRRSNAHLKGIYSSSLIRWTSSSREKVFERIKMSCIDDLPIIDFIPKISEEYEHRIITELYKKNCTIKGSTMDGSAIQLYINATAYNWISVFDHIPPSKDKEGNRYIPNSLMSVPLSSEDDLYYYLAMLSNRITYWLWTICGDGFHVYKDFVLNLPFGKNNFTDEYYSKVVNLGKKYAIRIKEHPVSSSNCGKEIINYDYTKCWDIIEEVENLLSKEIKVNYKDINKIREWYDYHINCGRKRE